MIEAGIVAFAIIMVAIGSQVFYSDQQQKNREAQSEEAERLCREIAACTVVLQRTMENTTKVQREALQSNRILLGQLGPLCKNLAESLTARMSTIDADMADLRTRVETGPGAKTMQL